jgi:predicted metal-dependent enzyme (double-stranded beta helix superfamily)
MLTCPLTPAATKLIFDIRSAVLPGGNDRAVARRVTGVVQRYLMVDDLLGSVHCEPNTACYKQHVLHVEPDGSFSVVALVWLPGQSTPIHDHVSWCVVGTYRGVEEETSYQLHGDHLVPLATTLTPRGVASFLTPPGDIHMVRNASDDLAISIHVYGADVAALGSSVRRRYDLEVRQPVPTA